MTINFLLLNAHQFLVDRDWLQYHNPKNDAFNIYVEAGELAEHFITHGSIVDEKMRVEVAKEMADVFFAVLGFASVDTCNIAKCIGSLVKNAQLEDQNSTYEQLREIILYHKNAVRFSDDLAPRQLILALVAEASKLCDLFLWCSIEESRARAIKQKQRVDEHIARIFAHLVLLADLFSLDLIAEYQYKMEQNAQKYPVSEVSGSLEKYIVLKDERYHKKNDKK